MEKLDVKEVRIGAKGRWLELLSSHGIPISYLKNKNGPCPRCNGKDRFRWDDKNGDGGGFCHQCDFKGSGLTLLGKWLDLTKREDFPKLLRVVSDFLGLKCGAKFVTTAEPNNLEKEKYIRNMALKIWLETDSLEKDQNSSALKYLRNRGLVFSKSFENLRYHKSLNYYENNKLAGQYPALVAKVTDNENNFLAIHRIYLDPAGKKANVREPKLALGKIDAGSIKFDEASDIVNIAEGIETALAVREMTKQPTWAAINAGNLAKSKFPARVKKVFIWADLDKSETGEKAASALASRLYYQGIPSVIRLPKVELPSGVKSIDWLDIYNDQTLQGGCNV